MTDALHDVRVLDLSHRASSAWCTRLLADFGADVVMVEPPGGHPLRRMGPFANDASSIPAAYMLANKRSIIRVHATNDELASLLQWAHVVVNDTLPGAALDYAAISEINPQLIVCSLTPFGQDGLRAGLPGNDLTLAALSGWASVNGLLHREPLKGSGFQASYQAGTMAYAAIVCALIHQRGNHTEGQHIDIAELEVLCSTFAPALLRTSLQGETQQRRASMDLTTGPIPVKDGYFALPLTRPHFWVQAMQLLNLPDLAADDMLQKTWYRLQHKDLFIDRVQEKMRHWTRRDLFEALSKRRVIAGPVLTMDELGENEQLQARGFFTKPAQANSNVVYPGAPFQLSASPWQLRHGMPEIGAQNDALPGDLARHTNPVPSQHCESPGTLGGPLTGYRGVVLTQAWAGTYATQLLGFMGAEIIQLETHTRLDSWRGTYDSPMPAALAAVPTAKHAWNCNPLFNSVNLNKQSITLDLTSPEGLEVFKRLVPHADFVAENFAPRVLGKLGIGYEVLRSIKPDIILCSLSGYGQSGPWRHVPAIGGTIEPASGMSALLGYPDGVPQNSGLMYPDAVAGIYGFAAIATALYHRDRTGTGQYIDVSMQEANATFVGDAWLEYAMTGQVRGTLGNRHAMLAPHGIYPCAGQGQWIAIACETDQQWETLCRLAQPSVWCHDTRFRHAEERKRHERTLDELIAAWTSTQAKRDLTERLSDAGIPAAAVLDACEVAADAGLRQRGHLVAVDHPEIGARIQSGVPFRMSRTPPRVGRHAPLLGQHTFEVLQRLLGMRRDTYDALVAQGISGTGSHDA